MNRVARLAQLIGEVEPVCVDCLCRLTEWAEWEVLMYLQTLAFAVEVDRGERRCELCCVVGPVVSLVALPDENDDERARP